MSKQQSGIADQPLSPSGQASRISEALASELTIRPIRLLALELTIERALAVLPNEERASLAQTCKLALAEWRTRHPAQVPLPGTGRENLALEDIRGVSDVVLSAEIHRNPMRNDMDLARKLLDDGYAPLVELGSKHGRLAVLATVALNDSIQAGRADSLVYIVTLLHSALRKSQSFVEEVAPKSSASTSDVMDKRIAESEKKTDQLFALLWPAVEANAKRNATLNEHRATGTAKNKQRKAENHARWSHMAKVLLGRHQNWLIEDAIAEIQRSGCAKKVDGSSYSLGTIRAGIKGVCREWRQADKARRKRDGLYAIHRS